MIDFSFISLHRSIQEVAEAIDDRRVATINYHDGVVIPTEGTIVQISNVEDGIAFDDIYTVLVVDGCDNVIADITERVAIYEVTHDSNATQQIGFEIKNAGLNYAGRTYLLKFIGQTQTFWSTPVSFRPANDPDITRLDYWNTDEFEGISYFNTQLRQSIYIKGLYENGIVNESTASVYDARFMKGGNVRMNPKVNRLFLDKYGFEYSTKFLFKRVQVAFNHNNLYFNGVRINDSPQLEDGEYLGSSNIFRTGFNANESETDRRYVAGLQIFVPFALTTRTPQGNQTSTTLPAFITGAFNQRITIGPGTLTLFDLGGNVVQSWNEGQIMAFGTTGFTVPMPAGLDNTGYYINFTSGLFISNVDGSTFAVTDSNTWAFNLVAGDYDPADYSTTDYLTI